MNTESKWITDNENSAEMISNSEYVPDTGRDECIYIPVWLWKRFDLSSTQRMICAEIYSFQCGNGCFASYAHFATLLNLSEETVKSEISRLRKKGIVRDLEPAEAQSRYPLWYRSQLRCMVLTDKFINES